MNERHPAAKPPITEEERVILRHIVARGEDQPAFATNGRHILVHLEDTGFIRYVGRIPGYGAHWYLFRATEAGVKEVSP